MDLALNPTLEAAQTSVGHFASADLILGALLDDVAKRQNSYVERNEERLMVDCSANSQV